VPALLLQLIGFGLLLLFSPALTCADEPPEAEEEDLREQLTEREGQIRLEEPRTYDIGGRPLILGGQIETVLDYIDPMALGDPDLDKDRLLLEQEIELEVFYSFGPHLSLFGQVHLAQEEDVLSGSPEDVSDFFLERGEMWLYAGDVADSGFNVEAGRLDFEDDRRWWWNDDLDALRISYETERSEITLATARELAPRRSDQSYVEPDYDRVLRYVFEASWDWQPNHALELFALYQDDHSKSEVVGQVVSREREDDSDANLTWVGLRAAGASATASHGMFGYWVDVAFVRGHERLAEFEEISLHRSVVDEVTRRDVSGWGLDVGGTWMFPGEAEPRVTLSYAMGSGDDNPENGTDRSFRQTGIHENEGGFGGLELFRPYGELLDPELSNLSIFSGGVGISLFDASSLDLVYHYYRLQEPAESLRDSRLEVELNGEDRSLGHGVDLILAMEEWKRMELQLIGSTYKSGSALGDERGKWVVGGLFLIRFAF